MFLKIAAQAFGAGDFLIKFFPIKKVHYCLYIIVFIFWRCTMVQKELLYNYFMDGEKKGKKMSPEQVARPIRSVFFAQNSK